jgi:hypothetical protein
MNRRSQSVIVCIIAIALFANWAEPAFGQAQAKPPLKSRQAWTLDEALAQLSVYPQDAYLQYVALQLARRAGRLPDVITRIEETSLRRAGDERSERASDINLFSLFSGALAVQESLQLEAMRAGEQAPKSAQVAPIASLVGPAVKSHPWAEMLKAKMPGGKKPDISPLSLLTPDDFYFAEFRSLSKMLDAIDASDLWGTHIFDQAFKDARTHRSAERLKRQLALETDPLATAFYDQAVEEAAVAGSDLFLREGSDATLLFRIKQPEIFRERMETLLASAEKSRPDAKRATGRYLDIDYTELRTPDRDISVFAAYPAPNIYVRSNSKIAFQKILEAISGKTADGKAVRRLGETSEFAYIRALMPRGASEEDGFVYLSDPFIRKLVGAQLKIAESRRMICYNHLRMIGHGALLYLTERGKPPDSLEELAKTGCAPGVFGQRELACPEGGHYSLSSDGETGVCSVHLRANSLTPCIEIPALKATVKEANEYKAFVTDYNQYWRTFFDPIAIRLQITPERYRIETIILPLIDNSIYTSLASTLGGEPEPLDADRVPPRNIFSIAVRFNKERLLAGEAGKPGEPRSEGLIKSLGISDEWDRSLGITEFISKGLGNQLGFHVYDAHPTFDFNLPSFIGMMAGAFDGSAGSLTSTEVLITFAVAALNTPVYISIPVQNAKTADRFLENLDKGLALIAREPEGGGLFGLKQDFYKFAMGGEQNVRAYTLKLGPVKLRIFWARIGDKLYVASKPFILEDLVALESERPAKLAEESPASHAMLRIRPQNWNQVLPDFRLGWAENNREACLNNLSLISSVARALAARRAIAQQTQSASIQSNDELGVEAHLYADKLYAVHHFCPDDGRYEVSADGKEIICSVHGTARAPRQPAAPVETSAQGKLLKDFAGLTTTLTFMKDGLHAIVVIDRK